jgi:uncharacterized protein YggT (Ycf19 family)
MLIFRDFLLALFQVLLDFYYYGLWVFIIVGLLRLDQHTFWYRWLHRFVAPPIEGMRRLTKGKAQWGPIDFTPMLVVLCFPLLRLLFFWILSPLARW